MKYVDTNLLPNEEVVYRTELHWIIYVPAAFWIILAIVILINVTLTRDTSAMPWALACFVLGGILAIIAKIRSEACEFAVTTKRLIIKTGVLRRHTIEMLLRQVEVIGIDQGIMGRILDYGTLTVGGTGGTKEPFHRIAHPLEFRRQVQSLTTD